MIRKNLGDREPLFETRTKGHKKSFAHRSCKKVGVAPLPFREAVGGGWQKNKLTFY